MAFGKDPNALNKVAAFGGSLKQQNRMVNQARPQRRAAAPYFVGQYKPIMDEGASPDRIRLIKGEYEVPIVMQVPGTKDLEVVNRTLMYYPCVEHTFMVGPRQPRGYLCSGGPFHKFRDKREPCHGCENYWNNKSNKSSPHGLADLAVFTVLHFAHYAKTPQVDKEGNFRMNEKTGEPYYEWLRIFPHELRKYQNDGIEIRDWSLLHWPMKYGAFNSISEYDEQVSKCCTNCGGKFSIETVVYLCEGCGTDLIDPNDGIRTPDEVEKAVSEPMTCTSCKHTGMLKPLIQCNSCQNPMRADIFDVDLLVKRVKDVKTERPTLVMMGFEGPKPLDQRFLVPGEDGRKPIAHPLDLPLIYAPTPLEMQEQILGGSKTGRAPVTNQNFSQAWTAPQGTQGPATGGNGPNYG